MSHSTIEFSPSGTPLLDRTVGELVAERPGRSRVFQAHAIDFCCQGNRTLAEACQRKNVPAATVVRELEAEAADKAVPEENPALLPADRLCEYVVETHHGYLRQELPRLRAMAERVAHVHGGHTPSLVELNQVFTGLLNELVSHLQKEEQVLFPAVVAMSRGEPGSGSLDGPIGAMLREHDEAGSALARMRELTNGYQPPADACNTYRALFAGLKDLEEDLHRHIHLENSVLFPAARKMAGISAN